MKLGLVSLLCVMMVPSVYAADMGMKEQPMDKPMMESSQKMDGMKHDDKTMGGMKHDDKMMGGMKHDDKMMGDMKHDDKMMGDMKHDDKMMGDMKSDMKADKMDGMHSSDMGDKHKKPMM